MNFFFRSENTALQEGQAAQEDTWKLAVYCEFFLYSFLIPAEKFMFLRDRWTFHLLILLN